MSKEFLSTDNLPFCKGCGHSLVARAIEQALNKAKGMSILDLIIVTDIGCIGIIDKVFHCHTVHGLHGRSVALASGIRLGLENPDKKILVLLGDGGATIGLQHLLDAAHRNVNIKVIVHNNMLYGMTGGQPSSLTPCGYKTQILPEGKNDTGIDLRALVSAAGAPFASRVIATPNMVNDIEDLFNSDGFAFMEVLEFCTSHGTKLNPGKSIVAIAQEAGLELGILKKTKPDSLHVFKDAPPSLFGRIKKTPIRWSPGLPWNRAKSESENVRIARRISIVLSGSAGEGVQTAAEILAHTAMACGLHVTKKGSYPVTVGIGFSMAEVIISETPIRYSGAGKPNTVLISSFDGLEKVKSLLANSEFISVYADASIETEVKQCIGKSTPQALLVKPYRDKMGAKSALLIALAGYLIRENELPLEAYIEAIHEEMGNKANLDVLKAAFLELSR